MATDIPLKKLILVPAVITLAVTLLRLVGELLNWSPVLFSRKAGGGGAVIGIVWLVFIFGIYFAWRLAAAGELPARTGAALGQAFLGFLVVPVMGFAAVMLGASREGFGALFGVIILGSAIGGVIAYRAWPALGRVLLAYALAARIPVALVMLAAIFGNWGTHYDVAPPDFPEMSPFAKWFLIGLVPQMTVWIWFTIAVGALLGGLFLAIRGRAQRPATA